MAKLTFAKENSEFELEVGEEIYTGILHDLNTRQLAAQNKILSPIKKLNSEVMKAFAKIERLQTKLKTKQRLEDWKTLDKIEDEIFELQDEIKSKEVTIKDFTEKKQPQLFKKRIEDTVESDDLKDILEAGKKHGYENVFNTILQDIDERNKKK